MAASKKGGTQDVVWTPLIHAVLVPPPLYLLICLLHPHNHLRLCVLSLCRPVWPQNFHFILLIDPNNASEVERAEAAVKRMVQIAWDAGGTCTGEVSWGALVVPH